MKITPKVIDHLNRVAVGLMHRIVEKHYADTGEDVTIENLRPGLVQSYENLKDDEMKLINFIHTLKMKEV